MSNPLKLVIFDCDGTLVDSQHLIVSAMSSAYEAHALPVPDREAMLSIVGLSLVEAFSVLGNGAEDFPVASLAEGYKNAFHALREGGAAVEPLYPALRKPLDRSHGAMTWRLALQPASRSAACGWCSAITA